MTTISKKINKYHFFNNSFNYTINNFDYFTTDYNIEDDRLISERDEYTTYFSVILKNINKKNIIDVGGNCGLFCVPLSKYGYHLSVFEPVSLNYELILKNYNENNIDNYELINSAIMNFNGNKEIYVPYCSDNSSFNLDVSISNMKLKNYEIENVKCLKFDTWLESKNEEFKENIGLIKIDVQGFEFDCLMSMNNFLSKYNDLFILLEWDKKHTEMSGNKLEEISNFLYEKGFSIFQDLGGDIFFHKK